MASLFQVTCLILLIGIAPSEAFSSRTKQRFQSDQFSNSTNLNSTMISVFNDMHKIMESMNQRFQRLFGFSSFPTNSMGNWPDNRKKLDAVEPICTTNTDLPSSTTSLQKNRRKKFRNTQTTTCIKELIIDGQKQMYKEMNVTDDKGLLISQSKIYQTISINTNNNTIPFDINRDKNVISY